MGFYVSFGFFLEIWKEKSNKILETYKFTGGVLYIVYILFYYLIETDVPADIVYWIMMFFAPFSLLDCFVKIASIHLIAEKPSSNFEFDEYRSLNTGELCQTPYVFVISARR